MKRCIVLAIFLLTSCTRLAESLKPLKKHWISALLAAALWASGARPTYGVSKETLQMMAQLDTLQRAVQDLQKTVDTQRGELRAAVADLKQSQAQLQAVVIRQQRQLQDLEQLVSSMRISGEENFSGLKSTLTQLRTETQKSFATLSGRAAEAAAPVTGAEAAPAPRPAAPAASQVVQGYVTVVDGNNVMVDIGSTQGLHAGSRLAVYKATDQTMRVGVLEVTQVVDGGNSRARIVTMNTGIRLEFSDIVRLE